MTYKEIEESTKKFAEKTHNDEARNMTTHMDKIMDYLKKLEVDTIGLTIDKVHSIIHRTYHETFEQKFRKHDRL